MNEIKFKVGTLIINPSFDNVLSVKNEVRLNVSKLVRHNVWNPMIDLQNLIDIIASESEELVRRLVILSTANKKQKKLLLKEFLK